LLAITGLSETSVGFAIMSVMTSTPEISVAIFSLLQGTPEISVGDVLGSNVFNIGIVVGLLATLGFLKKSSTDLLVELLDILFLSSLVPILVIAIPLTPFKFLSPFIGVTLLGIFVFSIYRITRKRSPALEDHPSRVSDKKKNKIVVTLKIVGSIAIVILAARFVVFSASDIAIGIGVLPILIGAKIISIGTSLPELALDLTAARRGRIHLAIGDAIGSNLTNITLVLGIILTASPVAFDAIAFTEIIPFVLITTLILWRYLMKGGVSQIGGIILILIYVLFQATIV
jgi:cation:H+ antiporter